MANTSVKPHPFETVPPGEAEQIQEIADLTLQLMQRRYSKNLSIRRGVHPKDHGCVRAVFEVNSDLPMKYRVGVFAKPSHKYDAWVRFSNAAAVIGPDLAAGKPDNERHGSRGMAIKLMGVKDDVIIPHQGAPTQDFLMINSRVFPFANVSDYLTLTQGLVQHQDDTTKAFGVLLEKLKGDAAGRERLGRAVAITKQIQAAPLINPLAGHYFGAAPSLFGDHHVMRYSAKSLGSEKAEMPQHPSDTYLREALIKQLGEKEAVFDFQLHLRIHDGKTDLHIEDASQDWEEKKDDEFESVARVTIPVQEVDTGESRTICENLFFTPWHSLAEHRPLGGINRLRNEVYFASSHHRHHPKEPSGREWFR